MKRSYYLAAGVITAIAMLATVPLVLSGSQQSVQQMFNAPRLWVPPHFEARRQFAEFVEQFEAQEAIFVSWPGCTVDDPRLKRLGEVLRDPEDDADQQRNSRLFSQVHTGYEAVRALTDEPPELSRRLALLRLKGTFVGPDAKTSCCIVFLTPQGAIDRDEAYRVIVEAAKRVVGVDEQTLYIAGPPVDGIAVDRESIRSIQRYALPSAAISFVLCWICLRSFWLTIPVIAVAAFSEGVMLASVGMVGATMNAILIVLPPLVYVLTVSAGVHLVNYYLDAAKNGPQRSATTSALSKGWLPCFLAAATTAIGLGSLLVSDVEPVRQFGLLAAAGVMMTFFLLLLLLPAVMELRPLLPSWGRNSGSDSRLPDVDSLSDRGWAWLAQRIGRSWAVLTVLTVLVMLGAGWGLTAVRTSVSGVNLLLDENPFVADFRWFEQHVGPLIPVELIVRMDPQDRTNLLERIELVRDVQFSLAQISGVDGVISAATFAPPIPRGGGISRTARRAAIRSGLEDQQERFVSAGYLHETPQQQSWRVSGRVQANQDIDYARFLDQIAAEVEPIVDRFREQHGSEVRVTYTGVTPVVDEAQRALLRDLFRSFLTALGLVTIVMVVVLKNVPAGLVSMIPNVFPATILFGLMGWLGIAVDIGTVMTASVALGIAVDGTLHFLNWFGREVASGATRVEAVRRSYRHCGQALAQTTIICALGLLIYTMSGFVPARNFSWMMLLMLVTAMVGDLIVLPALLVGPAGNLFLKKKRPEAEPRRESVSTVS